MDVAIVGIGIHPFGRTPSRTGLQQGAFAAREALQDATKSLEEATMWIAGNAPQDPEQAGAAAAPYLRLMALTVIAYLWSRMAGEAKQQLEAGQGNTPLLESKIASARYYFDKLLPEKEWLLRDISSGKDSVMALNDEHWVF